MKQSIVFRELSVGAFFRSSLSHKEGVFLKTPSSSDPALINMWTNAMRVLPELGVVAFGPDGFEYFDDQDVVERTFFRLVEE